MGGVNSTKTHFFWHFFVKNRLNLSFVNVRFFIKIMFFDIRKACRFMKVQYFCFFFCTFSIFLMTSITRKSKFLLKISIFLQFFCCILQLQKLSLQLAFDVYFFWHFLTKKTHFFVLFSIANSEFSTSFPMCFWNLYSFQLCTCVT